MAATLQSPIVPEMTERYQPWLATYRAEGIPATIDPDAWASVVHLLEDAMRAHGPRVAFRTRTRQLRYDELERDSAALCAWLQEVAHVRKGDRVALVMPNVLAFPVATLAILRAGAVQVNVNPLYTARELEHQLVDAQVDVAIVHDDAAAALAAGLARTRIHTLLVAGRGDAPAPAAPGRFGQVKAFDFDQAVRVGAGMARRPVALSGADPLFLQYTGGTTGVSKGAVLSHRNLLANIEQFKAMNIGALHPGAETIVTAIPLYHIFALTVNFLAYASLGAENWLVDDARDTAALIDVLRAARPTVFVGVNTLYASLLRHPRLAEADFSRLALSIGGGAAVLRTVSDGWRSATGTFIREGYGLTEASPIVTFNPLSRRDFSGATGLPLPGTDVRLLDQDGRDVAPGASGEVCIKGPQVMAGYWRQPQASAEAFTADGYLKTGDIGIVDPDGQLRIVERKKDLVIVSGFNVYPTEVEAVASTLAGVAECACVGVPDARSGEALALFVVVAPGYTLDEQQVVAHCRAALTPYKVPRIVRLVATLPKSGVGKILRRALQQSFTEQQTGTPCKETP